MVEDGVEVVVKSGVAEGGGNEPRAFIDSFLLYEPQIQEVVEVVVKCGECGGEEWQKMVVCIRAYINRSQSWDIQVVDIGGDKGDGGGSWRRVEDSGKGWQ